MEEPRRILMLIKGLGRGGAEKLVSSAARYLDRDRFTPRVAYLLSHKDQLVDEIRSLDVETLCLGASPTHWIRGLRRVVRNGDADLVHVHSPVAAAGARIALTGSDVPLVYTEHNVWADYHPMTRVANMLTYPRNNHVFAVSDAVATTIRYPRMLRWMRMPPVEPLHHGIEPEQVDVKKDRSQVREEIGVADQAPVIVTVANLRRSKGHVHLLEAAADIRKTHAEARFVLIGQGPSAAEISSEIAARGLADEVKMLGYRTDAAEVVAASDIFVLPSLHEGLPLALLEAMALGKPSVVTNVGGVPEVVHPGTDSLVVEPGDATGLATAIRSLLDDPIRATEMGRSARAAMARFDVDRAVRRMEEVYEDLLS